MHLPCQRGKEVKRVLPGHLLVNPNMSADDINAHRFQLRCPGRGIGCIDQVCHQPDTIKPRCPDCVGHHCIVRIGKDTDNICSRLCRHLHLDRPGVGDFHIGYNRYLREMIP